MSEMIEPVAKALYLHDGGDEENWDIMVLDVWLARGRAAIEAMRQPSDAIRKHIATLLADDRGNPVDASTCDVEWNFLIDAALKQ